MQALNSALISLGYSSASSSTSNAGVSLKVGYGFEDDSLGAEAYFAHLGTLTINTTLTGPSETLTTEIDAYGIGFDLIGKYSIGSDGELLGRLGFFSYDTDITLTTTQGSVSGPLSSGTQPTFGFGYQVGNWRYEWQRFLVDETNFDNISISYLF